MPIPRTPSRLRNEPLFHSVDAVVYVEGGSGAETAATVQSSLDIAFWQMLFSVFAPGFKAHFKAAGSKSQLMPIINKLETRVIDSTIVCIDRDHGHLTETHESPRVMRTLGYSWENDLWSLSTMVDLFYTFCPVDRGSIQIEGAVANALSYFSDRMKWAARADLLLAQCGRTALPRKNFSCVNIRKTEHPEINQQCLREWLRAANRERGNTRLTLPKGTRVSVELDVYGHLLAHYCFHVLFALSQKLAKRSLRKDEVQAVAIRLKPQHIAEGDQLSTHYRLQFERWLRD